MSNRTTPTGRRVSRDGLVYMEFERTFPKSVEDVWAAISEPDRLKRWIGTWSGDPSSGEVAFRMTAEDEDAQEVAYSIHECSPPSRLQVSAPSPEGGAAWRLDLRLMTSEAGFTTLLFTQEVVGPEMAESVAPGWDYYLDRLVVAESGRDVNAVRFEDYYPIHAEHYRSLFA